MAVATSRGCLMHRPGAFCSFYGAGWCKFYMGVQEVTQQWRLLGSKVHPELCSVSPLRLHQVSAVSGPVARCLYLFKAGAKRALSQYLCISGRYGMSVIGVVVALRSSWVRVDHLAVRCANR